MAKQISLRYRVMTVNALGLTYETRMRAFYNDENPGFMLDISNGYPAYVKEEIRDDNALFHQIRQLINIDSTSGVQTHNPSPCLLDKIIILDFGDIFNRMNSERYEVDDAIQAIQNDSMENSWGRRLSLLLDSDVGINIKYPDGSVHRFVPFHKSASMAKRSRISYIEDVLEKELDRRLRLDMDFGKISLSLSKYYAYMGLYLTSGTRIPSDESHFKLNEETVIVLPDLKIRPENDFGGPPLVYTPVNQPEPNTDEKYEFEEKEESVDVTVFDGQGFISFDYAAYIDECLGAKPSSIQVRLPFIKGVLHVADFHGFIKEKESGTKIKDFLGIERDITRAHIIINESMFKCHDWIKDYAENDGKCIIDGYGGDAMRFFFCKLKEFDHSVYVSGSDAAFHPNGYDKLNYQFIDTLKLSHEDIEELVRQHFHNGLTQLLFYLHPDKDPYDKRAVEKSKPYIAAACMNPAFYKEKRLVDDAVQQVKNIRIDCGMGVLYTEGEHRYLSSDLAAYFEYINALCNGKEPGQIDAKFFMAKEHLLSNQFYMPQNKNSPLKIKNNEFYALFRSPHLSRNEECLLKAFVPKSGKDVYKKYFGHLLGTIMIPITSLVALILGGSDGDGDTCKIYANEIIVNAVKAGAYDNDGKRKLPIVNIPSAKLKKTVIGDKKEYKELILNTFSSYIGKISNLSVTYSMEEYVYSNESLNCGYCAQTTAIGGIDVDAGKNGGHPYANIKYLTDEKKPFGSSGADYIAFKDFLKRIRGTSAYSTKKSADGYALSRVGLNKPLKIVRYSDDEHALLYLPYRFAQLDSCSDDRKELSCPGYLTKSPRNAQKFKFEKESDTYDNTDANIVAEVSSLISSYKTLRGAIRYCNHKKKKTDTYSKLIAMLETKYDSFFSDFSYISVEDGRKLIQTDLRVDEIFRETLEFMRTCFINKGEVYAAIERAKNGWLFCRADQRKIRLAEILALKGPEQIPPNISGLLCDFSFSGFYLLYYLLEYIYIEYLELVSPIDTLSNWNDGKDDRDVKYYDDLLEYYKNAVNLDPATDQYSSENFDPEDSGTDDEDDLDDDETNNFSLDEDSNDLEEDGTGTEDYDDPNGGCKSTSGWLSSLNADTFNKLLEIVDKECKLDDVNRQRVALEYVYKACKVSDKSGNFFWNVIPRQLILDNVYRV